MSDPVSFAEEFVEPAIELARLNRTIKHTSVHAIAQLDILAEVVALKSQQKPSLYRDQLGSREPVLAVIRDAHDSHKHGTLGRKTAVSLSKGQRPEDAVKAAFFAGVSRAGGPPTRYNVLIYTLDDQTQWDVQLLLFEAREAWRREFGRLGFLWPASS